MWTSEKNERRAAFLAGEGTLTAQEVREWAAELVPHQTVSPLPTGFPPDEPLMVSVIPGPPDRRGLTGAQVL